MWAKVKKETKVTNTGSVPSKQDELSLEEQQALQKSRYHHQTNIIVIMFIPIQLSAILKGISEM